VYRLNTDSIFDRLLYQSHTEPPSTAKTSTYIGSCVPPPSIVNNILWFV